MTQNDLTPSSPVSPAYLLVDALLDGESVDKQALRDALDDRAAREYLVDALVVRQLTREMGPLTFVPPTARTRPVRWFVSAAVLTLVAAGGFLAGQRHEPATSTDSSVTNPPAVTAPTPTKIIRLEPGVSWTNDDRRP